MSAKNCTPPIAALLVGLLLAGTSPARADDPSTQPARVDVTKKDQFTAAVADGRTVILTGVVESAQWNGPSKMLIVKFKGAPDNFQAVAVPKQRPALDKAFDTDVTMTITGHPVEITGNLKRYEGKADGRKGMIEIAITKPEKLKVMDAAKPAKPAK